MLRRNLLYKGEREIGFSVQSYRTTEREVSELYRGCLNQTEELPS
jgi:hypothetical protein